MFFKELEKSENASCPTGGKKKKKEIEQEIA